MRPRALIRSLHLWAGLALSLLLLVLGVTGSALVYKEAYWRLVYPELREAPAVVTAADHAAAIAAAEAMFGEGLRSVKLPEPGVAGYHLYLTDGEAFLAMGDHRLIDRWKPTERLMPLLFDIHAHLMAGEAGERVGGVIGLLGTLLVLTGVYLWWPARRRFGIRTLMPDGLSRRKLLPSHRDLGLIASPVLLILLLTGSGIVFYGTTGMILNGIFSRSAPVAERAPAADGAALPDSASLAESGRTASPELLELAATTFPAARVVFYYPPDAAGIHGFRIKQECEVHPNGRSYLYAGTGGRLLRTVDACAQPAGQRALYSVYPLHAGKLDSGSYKVLVFLGGLVLAVISATGVGSYIAKLMGAR